MAAAWTLEDRRCDSSANVEDVLLDEAGNNILVTGDIYGSRFMAILDAQNLEEKAMVFDIEWNVAAPKFVDAETIVTVGDMVRFWDVNTLEVLRELELEQPIRNAIFWDDTLVATSVDGSIQQFHCHTGH